MWKQCESLQDSIVTFRRDLHQIPEVGLHLPKTSDYVAAELDRLRAENAALQALLLRCGAPVTDLSGEGLALDPVSPKEFLEQVADAQTEKAEDAPAPAPATNNATDDAPAPGDKPRKGRNAMGSMFDLLSFDDVD